MLKRKLPEPVEAAEAALVEAAEVEAAEPELVEAAEPAEVVHPVEAVHLAEVVHLAEAVHPAEEVHPALRELRLHRLHRHSRLVSDSPTTAVKILAGIRCQMIYQSLKNSFNP